MESSPRAGWSEEDARRFGDALSLRRRRTGMSQRRLATLSGLSQTTIAVLESGKKSGRIGKPVRPSADTIGRIASALATDLADETTVDRQRAQEHYEELMTTAGYGVEHTLAETGEREISPQQQPKPRRQRTSGGKIEFLAPVPRPGMSREEIEEVERRFEDAVADVRALFRRIRAEHRASGSGGEDD